MVIGPSTSHWSAKGSRGGSAAAGPARATPRPIVVDAERPRPRALRTAIRREGGTGFRVVRAMRVMTDLLFVVGRSRIHAGDGGPRRANPPTWHPGPHPGDL